MLPENLRPAPSEDLSYLQDGKLPLGASCTKITSGFLAGDYL